VGGVAGPGGAGGLGPRSAAGSWLASGVSGDLVLDGLGRIHRDMPFAQFRGGQPVAVDTAPGGERLAVAPEIDARAP
jgi:hypothetical protein